MFNVVKGESLAVQEGDHFSMILPDGSSFNCEQTADDFSIVGMDGKVMLSRATSKSAKADDAHQILLDKAMDDALCEENEACPGCGNRDKATLSITEDHVHCVKCGDGYDIPATSLRNVNGVERLRRAVEGLLANYRTDTCPIRCDCVGCQKSRAAKEFAEAALVKTSPVPTWTKEDLTALSREALFGIYAVACLDNMPCGGEDPTDYSVVYLTFQNTPAATIIHQLAQMRMVQHGTL